MLRNVMYVQQVDQFRRDFWQRAIWRQCIRCVLPRQMHVNRLLFTYL